MADKYDTGQTTKTLPLPKPWRSVTPPPPNTTIWKGVQTMPRSTERSAPPEEPYRNSYLPKGVSMSPKGDVGEHRGMEAYELGTFNGCKTMTKKMAGWKTMTDHTATDAPFKGKGA